MEAASDSNFGALTEYSRLKLELASIIRSLMQLAHARNDRGQEVDCQKLMARLAEDRFNLAVVGQFNRGKTSLMNALLGSDKLPTGILPVTSVVTAVCYGDREQAVIRIRDSYLHQAISLEELPLFLTEKDNPGNTKRVALAEVRLPVSLLRLGFFFMDTPGVGSVIAANTATTRSFLPEMDAAIFVTSFEAPLSEGELTFFDEVKSHVGQIFVVINKSDLVKPEEREQVIAFVRDQLAQRSGVDDLPVFAVSARVALEAKLSDGSEFTDSGIQELESALVSFLRTGKGRVFLTRISDEGEMLLKEQAPARANAHPGELAVAEQALRAKAEQLLHEQDRILAPLGETVGADLLDRFQRELTDWHHKVHAELFERAEGFLRSADLLTLLAGAPELCAALAAACQERTHVWFGDHQEELQRVISDAAADCAAALDRCAAEAFEDGWSGRIRPKSARTIFDRVALALPPAPSFHWRFAIRWWIYVLPLQRVKKHVLRQCSASLEEALFSNVEEIRSYLRLIACDWVDAVHVKLAEAMRVMISRAEMVLRAKPQPAEHATLDELLARLSQLRNLFVTLDDEITSEHEPIADSRTRSGYAAEAGITNALASCAICSRLEKKLFQFMSDRQYDLGTKEVEQADHAERGGFCPLHTWYYEGIASAQGICTAYPSLLLSLSRRLQSLAQQSPSPASMANHVAQWVWDTNTCAVCDFMFNLEKQLAEQRAASLSMSVSKTDEELAALCLPHLSSVLHAISDERLARQLLQEQAKAMERVAEDMQRYALKHDAVRRDLATEGEWQAHKRALLRLVGSRNISKPWKPG